MNQWGSARYNTATQFIALVYDKHHGDRASKYSEWARSQMHYLMGENPLKRCYIVGYSDISVKYPHHRAASGLSRCEDTGKHRYVLYGALVGGPDAKDQHNDVTADYVYNEVAIDYNAAFVGACAGLYRFFGDASMQVTPDFPPSPETDPENPEDTSYWVEGFGVDIVQADGPKVTEVTLYVKSNVTKTSKNISVRYFFDATGMTSVSKEKMEIRQLYDQTAAETSYAAQLSGPYLYKDNIYYVEISWPGFVIANSNKKYQFALGTYTWGNNWNPSDDWSHQGLNIEKDNWTGTPVKTDHICVYDNGVLVGGVEPYGSTPVATTTSVVPSPTPTVSVGPTVTPTVTSGIVPTITPTQSVQPTIAPTVIVSPTPGGKLAVTYSVVTDWGVGATINVSIKNNSNAPVNGWQLDWTFANDQKITSMWNASFTQSGKTVTVKNEAFNSIIPAYGSVNFGFLISYSSGNAIPVITVK